MLVLLTVSLTVHAQPPVVTVQPKANPKVFRPTFKSLDSISLSIGMSGRAPKDRSAHLFQEKSAPQQPKFTARVFHWEASEYYHHPLYFDDTPLERYGQSRNQRLQPLISGAHFFGTLPVLPYKMGIDRYKDKIYTLGYYRPGSPAPCVGQQLPLEADAMLFESGAWVALIFLFP